MAGKDEADNKVSAFKSEVSWWHNLFTWLPPFVLFTVNFSTYSTQNSRSAEGCFWTFLENVTRICLAGIPLLLSWYDFLGQGFSEDSKASFANEPLVVRKLYVVADGYRRVSQFVLGNGRLGTSIRAIIGMVLMVVAYATLPLWAWTVPSHPALLHKQEETPGLAVGNLEGGRQQVPAVKYAPFSAGSDPVPSGAGDDPMADAAGGLPSASGGGDGLPRAVDAVPSPGDAGSASGGPRGAPRAGSPHFFGGGAAAGLEADSISHSLGAFIAEHPQCCPTPEGITPIQGKIDYARHADLGGMFTRTEGNHQGRKHLVDQVSVLVTSAVDLFLARGNETQGGRLPVDKLLNVVILPMGQQRTREPAIQELQQRIEAQQQSKSQYFVRSDERIAMVMPFLDGEHWVLMIAVDKKLIFINTLYAGSKPDQGREAVTTHIVATLAGREGDTQYIAYGDDNTQGYQRGDERCGDWVAAYTYAALAFLSDHPGVRFDSMPQAALLPYLSEYALRIKAIKTEAGGALEGVLKKQDNGQIDKLQETMLASHVDTLARWREGDWRCSHYVQWLKGMFHHVTVGLFKENSVTDQSIRHFGNVYHELSVLLRDVCYQEGDVPILMPFFAQSSANGDFATGFVSILEAFNDKVTVMSEDGSRVDHKLKGMLEPCQMWALMNDKVALAELMAAVINAVGNASAKAALGKIIGCINEGKLAEQLVKETMFDRVIQVLKVLVEGNDFGQIGPFMGDADLTSLLEYVEKAKEEAAQVRAGGLAPR